ncbi:MAG: hypothetical protein Q8N92_10755 [Erysipelotrichaceae bacterium]|nr:hypothetical protein [Erysipelotrichaceae bacterium]
MADIVERLEVMARSMRNAKKFVFNKNDQKIVGEMFRHFMDSEFLQSEFDSVEYSWYGYESYVKRKALEDSIGENDTMIQDCLHKLYGDILYFDRGMTDKSGPVSGCSDDILEEIAITSSTTFQMGINAELSEALDNYRYYLADFLIFCYDTFKLDVANEFYQNLLQLSDSRDESY